ncbi:hypothetical protein M405DRAFT_879343 [Rhizopogon salebrosus TDB-379]|nr:hypothetical protein M405DRAFT_879343 [Rhizopogon salebrosus TDB-379]
MSDTNTLPPPPPPTSAPAPDLYPPPPQQATTASYPPTPPVAATILPVQATTANYPPAPSRESTNNKQLPKFPQQWKPPSNPLLQRLFATACFLCLGQWDLKIFWRRLVEDNGWERYFTGSRDAVMQITTAQGLILAANAAFITTTPPLLSVDYTSGQCYRALSISFIFCIIGLVSQLMFFGVNLSLSRQISLRDPMSPTALMFYCVLSVIPLWVFIISLYSLAVAFLSTFMKPGYMLCMAYLLLYAFFPKIGHPNTYVVLICIFALVLCVLGVLVLILMPIP